MDPESSRSSEQVTHHQGDVFLVLFGSEDAGLYPGVWFASAVDGLKEVMMMKIFTYSAMFLVTYATYDARLCGLHALRSVVIWTSQCAQHNGLTSFERRSEAGSECGLTFESA